MDIVDRDLEKAEVEATRTYSARSSQDRETRYAEARRMGSGASVSSSSSSSIATAEGVAIRAAPIAMARTRTHPLEMHRTETYRLQHSHTVGRSKTTPSRLPLPEFGGGKPYPPDLPAQEEYVVEFNGKDDPLHPQNWPFKRKLYIGAILAYTCLCSSFTSSIFSTASKEIVRVFGVSLEVATLGSSLYVMGYAFGPLVWGPLSELQGRKLPIVIGMFGFSIFNMAVATAKDLQTVMLCRFFAGVFGSCPLSVVAAVFADMFNNKQRGTAITIFAAMVFLGPMLAPFIGGFIVTSYLGWRWTSYITSIMGFFSFGLNILFLKESYAPIILVEKAAELRRRTKNWGIHAKQEEIEVDFKELLTKNFSRPLRILATEPVVLLVTIYMSFIYALLYTFLTAYPLVFQGVHHMTPGVGGLPFFGMIVGIFIVAGYIIALTGQYNRKLAANGGVTVPEWRLPPVVIGGVLFAAGLFWFGWTGYSEKIPWIVPTLSGLFTGFGLLAIFIQLFNYIIDSYLMFAASAIAANSFLRSFAAAGFPLFSRQMFNNLGIQWAATLLGCLAALMVPIPMLFLKYGEKLREKSKFSPTHLMKPPPDDSEEEDEAADMAPQPTNGTSGTSGVERKED